MVHMMVHFTYFSYKYIWDNGVYIVKFFFTKNKRKNTFILHELNYMKNYLEN